MHAPEFWAVRKTFMEKYGVSYRGVDEAAPAAAEERIAQATANLEIAFSILKKRTDVVETVGNRLADAADAVPERITGVYLGGKTADVFSDPAIFDFKNYPASLYKKPGEKHPNRAALGTWGAWVNTYAKKNYGRPLFIACSADLADSTNIAGFAKDFDGETGWGWYERDKNPRGCLLPQQITEFTNAGITAGLASVNLASDPMNAFDGFWGACSTYGSFSYLKYGSMRLFSQLAQDCELKLGKVLWIAGHSGPETAEDSRTHFGIFETAVTQLFPEGHVIDLHPWEFNEVPVVLGAALAQKAPIVALHLTRPPVDDPGSAKRSGWPRTSRRRAARTSCATSSRESRDRGRCSSKGPSTTANLVSILPKLDEAGINVRIVAVISPSSSRSRIEALPRFDRLDRAALGRDVHHQPQPAHHAGVDRASGGRGLFAGLRLGQPLAHRRHRRRSRGRSPARARHIFAGIKRFADERASRLAKLRSTLDAIE